MLKLVVVITPHTEKWFDIAKAWEEIGAPGVTIIDSRGLYAVNKRARVEIEMTAFSMASILRQLEDTSRIIFSVTPEELVDDMIDRALEIIDLEAPNTGVAFVLDVDRAVGIRRRTSEQPPSENP